MKIYLAARWANREAMKEIRQEIENLGHPVVSTWIDHSLADQRLEAIRDLEDIQRSNLLILWPQIKEGVAHGGRLFEAGYAVALNKQFWVMDDEEAPGIFYTTADKIFKTWDEVYKDLARLDNKRG